MTPCPLPRLAITLGDPAGIGPEVVLKTLADPTLSAHCHITVFGSESILNQTLSQLQMVYPQSFELAEVALPEGGQITVGGGNRLSGEASFRYLEAAINQTLAGQFEGIVTAPIAKSAWQQAGHLFPGQTEVLAQWAGVQQFGMLFAGRSPFTGWQLLTLLATTHIPLRTVPNVLTPTLMDNKLALLLHCLASDFGLTHPTVAIAGLNPHSGEAGNLGKEEVDWLIPWLQQARNHYSQATLVGPIPPDTLWVSPGKAWLSTAEACSYDAVLALYHDQGLIPVKLLAFDQAINTTIDLPVFIQNFSRPRHRL